MALQKLVLKPGVNKEGTNYANEDGFYNSDKVRFRSGYAEKIGGWQNISYANTYYGIARSLWAWVSLTSETLVGLGTTQKFYINYGANYYDITPISTIGTLDSSYFSTTSGSLAVTVTDTNHNITTGSFVTFTKAHTTLSAAITYDATSIALTSVTGLPASGTVLIDNEQITYTAISTLTLTGCTRGVNSTIPTAHLSGATVISLEAITVGGLNMAGQFSVAKVVNVNTYVVIASSPATSTATGGSGTYAIYQINASTGAYTALSGWGASGWGIPSWGSSAVVTTTTPIRLWSQSNYDQDLIFALRNGAIYWWTKNTISFPRAITLNEQAATQVKVTTTASWLNGASSITVANTTSINTGATITDGIGIVSGTYVTTAWDFSTTVPLSQATVSVANTTTTTTLPNSATLPQTVTLTSVANYPTTGVIQVGAEQISYSGIVGNTLTITARGYNSTVVSLHAIGSVVTFIKTINTSVTFSFAGKHVPNKTLLVTTTSQNAFTVAFGANPYSPVDFNTTFDPLLVRWSDQDNPYEWVPETTNQSGEQRLSNGSVIVAASNTRQEILIWTDTALYSMQYLGPPYVFGINLLMDNLSIASQNAAITVNNVTYWMGVDRFYQYSGRVETLPCTLRQFIFGDINRSQLAQICCGTNEGFNEIWWFYPSANSFTNDRYVIYNHLENTWVYGNLNRTAWLDTQLEQNPLGAFSTEITFLSNAITSFQTSILLNDSVSLPASGTVTIGSEQISYGSVDYSTNYLNDCVRGANNTTAASHLAYAPVTFSTNNQIMFHEYGWDDGSNSVVVPFDAYIESSDFDIGDGMNFAYVWRILPDLSFSGSTAANPKCQLTVKVRQNSGAAYTPHSSDTRTVERTATYPVEQYTGQVYCRVRGRQMAFRMESKVADGTGIFWQMGMMRIDIRPDGRR
jgi:hypothetical protein